MRGCVLIVHDELAVRRWLGEFLGASGFKVLAASSGQEALAILEEDVPALLVIGVGMPLLSGWKLIEALAHYPDLSRIPRLLAGPELTPEAVGARALALLEKQSEKPADAAGPPDEVAAEGAGPRRAARA